MTDATLLGPVTIAGRTAPSRVMFGPHETNLARGREINDRHVAYYGRRAAGGAGLIVTETASVTPDDWPYERAPLATDCGPGWAAVAEHCKPHGSLVIAGLGHAGGQGSSAYSQSVLWAPSPVADAASRELPAEMEQPQIDDVVHGFAQAARLAAGAGLDGVELDAGPLGLLRQFHSGLTNMRGDGYGTDRLRLTREVIAAVRQALGAGRILALRMSCDELAPWAGVTPEQAAAQVDALADGIDLLVVARGGPYSTTAYRPTAHTPPAFNRDLCAAMRQAAAGRVPVVLQGSVVDIADAQAAVDGGACDLVEMTRAQIAEPNLVNLARAGASAQARPCVLCNQACHVRDNRNPVISCIGDPRSGHETSDPPVEGTDATAREVLVVGGGPAGLECARVLATRGHRVTLAERTDRLGGVLRPAAKGPGRERLALLTDWLESECRRLGVVIETGREITTDDLDDHAEVVLATGSRAYPRRYGTVHGVTVLDALEVLTTDLPSGEIVVHDPIGGPIGVGVAEWLAAQGRSIAIVTPDQIAGTLLSLTGDLAPANTRLQQAGVRREMRALVREAGDGRLVLEDVWTGVRREVPCAVLVDAGHRLPEETLYLTRPGTPRAGDAVAPRTVLEAILEGRRRAQEISVLPVTVR